MNSVLESINYDNIVQERWFNDFVSNEQLNVNDKLNLISRYAKCPQKVIDLYKYLTQIILKAVRMKYCACNWDVFYFGSLVNGLSIYGSDADVCLVSDPVPPVDSSTLLKTIRKTILPLRYMFPSCVCIYSARVPLLRVIHAWGLQIDVSINNTRLAFFNSELIKFYTDLSPSFSDLFLIVKLWAKVHNVQVSGCFSSYAICLLIIFSLQQQKLVPSVHMLQLSADEPRMVQGWDSSFSSNLSLFSPQAKVSTFELLEHFFQFYASFEFAFYIVSTYVGTKILKSAFAVEPEDEFKLYKNNPEAKLHLNCLAVIQDPFDHSFNTGKNISRMTLSTFQWLCSTSAELCSLLRGGKFDDKRFLEQLFKKKAKPKEKFILFPINPGLHEGSSEEEIRQMWVEKALAALSEVLRRIVLCEITEDTKGHIKCYSTCFVLNKKMRTAAANALNLVIKDLTLFKRNEEISQYISNLDDNLIRTPFTFQVKYDVVFPPTHLQLSFETDNKTKVSLGLLKANLVKWMENFMYDKKKYNDDDSESDLINSHDSLDDIQEGENNDPSLELGIDLKTNVNK